LKRPFHHLRHPLRANVIISALEDRYAVRGAKLFDEPEPVGSLRDVFGEERSVGRNVRFDLAWLSQAKAVPPATSACDLIAASKRADLKPQIKNHGFCESKMD
jgi:hypothetical protein